MLHPTGFFRLSGIYDLSDQSIDNERHTLWLVVSHSKKVCPAAHFFAINILSIHYYHFRGFFDGALSLYLARSHTNFRSHLRASFPAVLLLSERLMAGHIKETVILLFIMAGACLIVFLVPGLFVLFPGIL